MRGSIEIEGTFFSQQDERTVVYPLQECLIKGTFREFHGLLNKKQIEETDLLRKEMKNLISCLGIKKNFGPEDCLRMGIADFIREDLLENWASGKSLPENIEGSFPKFAKYFLEKKKTLEAENLPTSGAHEH